MLKCITDLSFLNFVNASLTSLRDQIGSGRCNAKNMALQAGTDPVRGVGGLGPFKQGQIL